MAQTSKAKSPASPGSPALCRSSNYGRNKTGGPGDVSVHAQLTFLLGSLYLLGSLAMVSGAKSRSQKTARMFFISALLWASFATAFKLAPDGFDGAFEKLAVLATALWTLPLATVLLRLWREAQWNSEADGNGCKLTPCQAISISDDLSSRRVFREGVLFCGSERPLLAIHLLPNAHHVNQALPVQGFQTPAAKFHRSFALQKFPSSFAEASALPGQANDWPIGRRIHRHSSVYWERTLAMHVDQLLPEIDIFLTVDMAP